MAIRYVTAAALTVALVVVLANVVRTDVPEDRGLSVLIEWQPSRSVYFECLVSAVSANPGSFGVTDGFFFDADPQEDSEFIMNDGEGRLRRVRYSPNALEVISFRPSRSYPLGSCGE